MKNINKNTIYIALGTLLIGLLLGWFFFGGTPESKTNEHQHEQSKSTVWTCSMHPQIRQPEPGQCPICGMDLIPLNSESSDEGNPMEIKMSPTAMQLANVQTSIISKKKPVKELRINGKVKADERRVFSQSSHIPGRIEKLLVSFTGESVSKGQILAYVYSPELVTAQEELFEAYKIKESQPELFQAAKGKLLNWKLTEKQVNSILLEGQVQEQFPVLADVSGVVLNKRVNLGDYIKKGQPIFEVADLSKVWVLFDVYESDIPWIKIGDDVKFTVQSLPGENFTGRITFIDPVINPKTRVALARVELENKGGKLKPDMFTLGVVNSPLEDQKEQIIVPKSSVMWTGERSVVYIKHASASGIGFMMREVILGPALGDSYIIKKGLDEGEEIATNGTFSIDAAAQLAGKPSMMNPEGGMAMTGHNHGVSSMNASQNHSEHNSSIGITTKAKSTLKPLYSSYFSIKDALVSDDYERAIKSSLVFKSELLKINMSVFNGRSHDYWMNYQKDLKKSIDISSKSTTIEEVRKQFLLLSEYMIGITKTFEPYNETLFIQHCSMADNNKGVNWLSADKDIKNPYFGESMLTCGELKEELK